MNKEIFITECKKANVDLEYWYDDTDLINDAIEKAGGKVAIDSFSTIDDATSPVTYYSNKLWKSIILSWDGMRGNVENYDEMYETLNDFNEEALKLEASITINQLPQ